jgi:hypothetical protein
VTLDTECEPFCLIATALSCALPDDAVHIEMRRLELLGNMHIMDETNMAERNCELEQEA